MKYRTGAVVLLAGLMIAPLSPPATAADTTRPRIVKAALGDADRDDRVDRIVLTYSERIRHALDTDGRYPFKVGNYTIRRVQAARSTKTLVILLREKAARDIAARPSVAYSPTRSKPVRDGTGNQAAKQTFRRTVALDRDGDGYASKDCAPANAAINPGAADKPDPSLVDANCDRIDGDPDDAVFVSETGSAGGSGTRGDPLDSVVEAVGDAAVAGKDVYVASGTFPAGSGLQLKSGMGIYGGFLADTWARSKDPALTEITGSPAAAVAAGDADVVLQLLSLHGTSSATPGSSAYGLRASDSTITAERVRLSAGNGAAGLDGSNPPSVPAPAQNGAAGQPGAEDSGGFCSGASQPQGGSGGSSPSGASGGRGGAAGHAANPGFAGSAAPGGGLGGPGTPSGQGNWSTPPMYWGQNGAPGAPGSAGPGGSSTYGASGYNPTNGSNGASGTSGRGGGGGGGGGGGTADCDSYGGSGGGGGAGGAGGLGGKGGTSGGGSFGIYLSSSTLTMRNSEVSAANGGNGGAGAAGQLGGAGGSGGPINPYGGGTEQDDGSNGGRGGNGGPGGAGGPGGGGAGGPSIGILVGSSSLLEQSAVTITVGSGGTGGASPSPGSAGPDGQSIALLTPS